MEERGLSCAGVDGGSRGGAALTGGRGGLCVADERSLVNFSL